MTEHTITSTLVPEHQRATVASKIFGANFIVIEASVFDMASHLSDDYAGGYWDFFMLSNGGFYMAPSGRPDNRVRCANGFEGKLSAEAFGITVCMYAHSHLSFSRNARLAELCANHYHLLRDFMLAHVEARHILAATD